MRRSRKTGTTYETAAVLVGQSRGGLWLARLKWPTHGSHASVDFDWQNVLAREESHGDIIGFFHTHPDGMPNPSRRDDLTMISWCSCFGKKLLCAIASVDQVRAWIYEADGKAPSAVTQISRFKGNWLVASEGI